MPPQYLFEFPSLSELPEIYGKEAIRRVNPQRGYMEMLDSIILADEDKGRLIGYVDVRDDAFWVPGHIPGRPLLPGVLMIEAAAQLASFYTRHVLKWDGFLGFGGVEDCRFRQQVAPPARLYIIGQQSWVRHGRVCCREQGIVNNTIVFEATIIGAKM